MTHGRSPHAAHNPLRRTLPRLALVVLLVPLVLALLATALVGAPASGAPTVRVRYDWPLAAARVTRGFDDPARPWLPGHRGVDLAAEPGEPVHAAAEGTVAFAGSVAGKPVVSIDHADGLRTTYEPVVAMVSAGSEVARGQPIGTVAAGGHGEDDLHWGARRAREDYVDPSLLVDPEVVIRLYAER